MKKMFLLALALAITPTLAHAQGGCIDSPENPTVLLALVGGVSAAVSVFRNRRAR